MNGGGLFSGWFGSPALVVLDSIRFVLMAASLFLEYRLVQAVFLARTSAQRALLAAFAGYVGIDIGYEFAELGGSFHWRLLVQAAALTVALWGAHRWIHGVPPAPPPPPPRRPR